jgi:hypothetical protein
MPDDVGNGEVPNPMEEKPKGGDKLADKPVDANPVAERAEAAAKAKDYLNDRSRTVAAAIIAVSWGWLASDPKLAVPLQPYWKTAIGVATGLSLFALLIDYIQFLFQYVDAISLRQFWGKGATYMFGFKQVLISVSTVLLIATAAVIGLNAIGAEAQPGEKWRVYSGTVWTEPNESDKKESRLFLSFPNPLTGFTAAVEDNIPCSGTQTKERLTLVCEKTGVRFDGTIDGKLYQGVWSTTSAGTANGHFRYTFARVWEKK